MNEQVLLAYGFLPNGIKHQQLDTGLINHTWKIESGHRSYILQTINTDVFPFPQDLEFNIVALRQHIASINHGYFFPLPIPTLQGTIFFEADNKIFRLYEFVPDSKTITVVENEKQAYEAALQFGRYIKNLQSLPANALRATLPNFHNLTKRFDELKQSIHLANHARKKNADALIKKAMNYGEIANTHHRIQTEKLIRRQAIHHDAKISNVLFNSNDEGICVIDLDTTMPGYFISDIGDLFRTCLSNTDENNSDINAINIRPAFFKAIAQGFIGEVGDMLSETEKKFIFYSGQFMIYMQAIRFLTDYLNGDIYYQIKYETQNFDRTLNQFTLLDAYQQHESEFTLALKNL